MADYVILPSLKHKIVSQQFKDNSEFINRNSMIAPVHYLFLNCLTPFLKPLLEHM